MAPSIATIREYLALPILWGSDKNWSFGRRYRSSSRSKAAIISELIFLTLSALNSKSQGLLYIERPVRSEIKIVGERGLLKAGSLLTVPLDQELAVLDHMVPE